MSALDDLLASCSAMPQRDAARAELEALRCGADTGKPWIPFDRAPWWLVTAALITIGFALGVLVEGAR